MSILPATLSSPRELPAVRRAQLRAEETAPQSQPQPSRPVTDEYIPSEKQEPSGLYRLGRAEDGSPKIFFDDPERDAPEGAPEPDKAGDGKKPPENGKPGRKEEVCKGNTDQVDREIKRLRKRREELAAQLRTERDPAKAGALERKLAQVESELRQKDNDAYRRQHTQFTQM